MAQYGTNAQFSNAEPRSGPKWWIWLIVALAACACLACGGLFGFFAYFGREPEGISLNYSIPARVTKGENFDLVLHITNSGAEPVTVNDIDLDEALGGSILDGAIVLETDPPMERDYSLEGVKTFLYDRVVEAGATNDVVFHMQATDVGEFGGSVGVYVGDIAKRIDYLSLIVQQ